MRTMTTMERNQDEHASASLAWKWIHLLEQKTSEPVCGLPVLLINLIRRGSRRTLRLAMIPFIDTVTKNRPKY